MAHGRESSDRAWALCVWRQGLEQQGLPHRPPALVEGGIKLLKTSLALLNVLDLALQLRGLRFPKIAA